MTKEFGSGRMRRRGKARQEKFDREEDVMKDVLRSVNYSRSLP